MPDVVITILEYFTVVGDYINTMKTTYKIKF